MIKEIEGDLLQLAREGHFDIIAHGANCFCTMGSGIAKQIHEEFPEAFDADSTYTTRGDIKKLGNFTFVQAKNYPFLIVNAYTQYRYGLEKVHVDYESLALILRKINVIYPGKRIGLPLIGAGRAGGDWNKIKNIIEQELTDLDVTIVHFKAPKIQVHFNN